jgi:hypothetical protein
VLATTNLLFPGIKASRISGAVQMIVAIQAMNPAIATYWQAAATQTKA